ncbi:MAG: ABC transporter substrate-binding protein [Bacteroidaceae bacterium]|nr:ABC transporter substrate-binding protein [Bacteroidaceae bacterium]
MVVALLLIGCHTGKTPSTKGETSAMRYATLLRCEQGDGYTRWTLVNPWDTTEVLHQYVLVPADAELPSALPNGTLIRTPLHRAGVATAVHCGMMNELGCADAITGVCESQFIDLPVVTRGIADGSIADFGNGMNPNIEQIMETQPDVLLLTPFEHSGGYGRVERLGIPIIECAEYMEVSPLARAEWLRFYAVLFGAEAVADSIFASVEKQYNELTTLASQAPTHPRLLTEMLYGGQWFVPAGNSTMGMMFSDAAADYVFANLDGSGSTGLSFEAVLEAGEDADIWLIKVNQSTPYTYQQMEADYNPYTHFQAFRNRSIYVCDLAHNHFYEETPFHPERLLRDLICILHPTLLPGQQPVYYKPLDE